MIVDDSSERLDNGEEPEHEAERRKVVERIIPELIKKFIEVGVGKLAEGPKDLRHFVSEMRLPREAANYVFSQIDDTKNGLYRVVAREMRDFLEHTNLAEEIAKVLTKLSFEIRTEIRFVPNASDERLFPKPEVKAQVSVAKDKQEAPKEPKEERPKRRSR
jgi:hypothetical protein